MSVLYHIGIKWRPPNLSELTPMVFNPGLTHLGSEGSKYLGEKPPRVKLGTDYEGSNPMGVTQDF